MKRKRKALLLFLISCILLSLPITVSADTGPKPSVNVSFTGGEKKAFYVTLLSSTEGNGPWQSSNATDGELSESYGIDKEILDAFRSFGDDDEYYLFPYIEKCTDSFRWGYYPPKTFKILIYFPEEKHFAVSKIYERNAFDSYYEIDLSRTLKNLESINSTEGYTVSEIECKTVTRYDYLAEGKKLLARMIVTIAIELAVFLAFELINKRSLVFIILLNLVTQLILNTALNVEAYRHGMNYGYESLFLKLEAFIFISEAIFCTIVLPKLNCKRTRIVYALCAILANALSLAVGYKLYEFLPTIF